MITYRTLEIDGLDVFVREAGDRRAPAIVLLHGFPSSSHMFRDLIPLLADRFHVIAPDLIGFGHSAAPASNEFAYTFDSLTAVTRKVLERLEVSDYILYLQDYGGPVGLRLATSAPERVRGLVIQNANAYIEGIGEALAGVFVPLWKERNDETLAAARTFLTAASTRMLYTAGASHGASLNPDAWTLDQALLDRPGSADVQLALFVDYEKNVALYEAWQAYFREQQPRALVLWGKNDPLFVAAGAEAYRRDLRDVEVMMLDGSHFALEEHAVTIAAHIKRVFAPPRPLDLVTAFYRELGAGRYGSALALLARDVVWNDPTGFPYGGRLAGAAQVKREVLDRIAGEWAPFVVKLEQTVASSDGRTVFAAGRYIGQHRRTGRVLDVAFVHVWSGGHGELAGVETFTDTATIRQTMAS
jgi:pimeloyl-ACP methyl ester carboxylesterase/ketosteroid isomerase-like protein